MKNDLVGPGAANRKGVSDDSPLRFAIEAKDFAKIMNQAGENKPARVTVAADLFGGLKEVIELRKVCVGVAIVHERIQIVERFPNAHFTALERKEFLAPILDKVIGLVVVI